MISRLGRFEIQAEIGRGGFGQVFHALDPLMNRVVAVKVLTATEDIGSLNRFKNEAIAAGNLHHENIVTVYEFGQAGDVPFLVMEYLNGEDLLSVVKNQTPLSLYQKVRIMDQVADGLHCAHVNGVLHRDVKPANIMLLKDGGVKIIDFGIARLVRDTSTRLTQHGYVIGTMTYMAPELFAGEDTGVDALCDIWSYGVVMYELLSGKNPFHTGSLQSEMYRIVNHDPARLPEEICPADLWAVIAKLLSRDRQLRYSSLEDTRFDLQPILLNLKKVEADRLVSLAQKLMFEDRPAEALEPAREARKMDPQNGAARIIFERIQDQLRKQSVLPRIDDLLRRSNEAAEQRNFPDAIAHLETALRIDPSNQKVLARVQELRNLKAKREEAASLVDEASQGFRAGRLTDAFDRAADAVLLDPDNQEGRSLFENIEHAIRQREMEAALDAEILRARGLMAIGDLDGAMASLKAAESVYPERSVIKELAAQIADRIAERNRRQEFSRRLDEAKTAVRGGQFEQAIKELDHLQQLNPRDGEVADLLAYAKQELGSRERSQELKRITDAALEFNRTQNFAEAIQVLESGLKKFPSELSLTRLLRSTYTELQNFARDRALQEGLQRCQELRRSGKLQEALDLIGRLVSDNPDNRQLAELNLEISQEKSRSENTASVRTAVGEAEKLLRDGKPDSAISVLEAASRRAGSGPELQEVLKRAEKARQAEHDRQYIESELKHAKVFEERRDIATSLQIIEGALRQFPKSADLLAAKARLISAGLPTQKSDDATTIFAPAERDTPPGEKMRQGKSENVEQLIRDARVLLDAGRLDEARQLLSQDLSGHPDVPGVMQLDRDILLAHAAKSEQEGDFAAALTTLRNGLKKYPAAPELCVAEKRVQQKQERVEKLTAIRKDLESGNWQSTLTSLAEARAKFPENPAELASLERQARDRRERELKNGLAKLKGHIKEGRRAEAEAILKQQLAPFAAEPAVVALAKDLPRAPDPKNAKQKPAQQLPRAPEPAATPVSPSVPNPDVAAPSKWRMYGIGAAVLAVVLIGLVFSMRSSPVAVSPDKLSFAWHPGAAPVKQTIIVKGSSDAAVPQANAAWVTVTPGPRASGKTQFEVQVLPEKLRPGAYTALLTFAQNKKVTVDLVVAESRAQTPSGSGIQPASLLFQYSPAGVQPQKIVVTGMTPLPDPKPTERWLTATRRNLGPGKAEFLVQVAGNGLTPGLHSAELVFSADKKVPVQVMIPGGSASAVSPAFLRFVEGGPPQKITFMGSGDIPDPTPSATWLTVTRDSVSPGKAEFLVSTSSSELDPGKYDAYLTFGDKKVRVDLTVPEDPVTLEAKPDSLAFTAGGAPQTVIVTSTGDVPNPTVTDRWIKFTRRDLGAAIAEFEVQTNPAGLVPGPHVGYLNFSPATKVRIVLTVPPGNGPRR
jgi:serine/threonine-protein kinase